MKKTADPAGREAKAVGGAANLALPQHTGTHMQLARVGALAGATVPGRRAAASLSRALALNAAMDS